jgi:hypothetical protein
MLIAGAGVETERSSRYLLQLCRHVDKAGQPHPQLRAHVEWSDDRGAISFRWGRGTLHALPGVLTLRTEAPDKDPCGGWSTHRRPPRADQQPRSPDGDLNPAPRPPRSGCRDRLQAQQTRGHPHD